ncbi:MAG TPA: hypothetical protein VID29_09000 [Solirubrobacteraceae bacterium]|jgi:hypothetical protein
MVARLFPFVQLEYPWALGPEDGRYVLRAQAGGEPEHVVVLTTVGAARGAGRRPARRGRSRSADPEPAPVPVARATVIDPADVPDEQRAQAWLGQLDAEREIESAVAVLNRVLFAQRIAAADAYLHEISAAQALAIRAGWGTGEQVADGAWTAARELPWSEPRGRRRASALRPQERFSALLGGHERALLCEELALRARADLDQGRLAHAALELQGAYACALSELGAERHAELSERAAELQELHAGVQRTATTYRTGERVEEPDAEVVRHALERLEATLRARTAYAPRA